MKLLLAFLLTFLPAQYISGLDVKPLTFDAKSFKDAFNQAAEFPRLVAVFSPT